jgi:hypothetical protein
VVLAGLPGVLSTRRISGHTAR